MQLLFLGGVHLRGGDVAVVEHFPENAVAHFIRAIRMDFGGRVAVRRANDSGEKRAFTERQFANVLAKVGLRGFAESADGEAAAIADVNFVGVQLENLLLAEALVELDGDDGLFDLPLPIALGGEEEAARQLHVNRARALRFLAAANIRPRRAENADEVEAAVLEESLVFGGKHGLNKLFREIIEALETPLLARGVSKRLVSSSGSISACVSDALSASAVIREMDFPLKSTRSPFPPLKYESLDGLISTKSLPAWNCPGEPSTSLSEYSARRR
jgi:hypothetical protein